MGKKAHKKAVKTTGAKKSKIQLHTHTHKLGNLQRAGEGEG